LAVSTGGSRANSMPPPEGRLNSNFGQQALSYINVARRVLRKSVP
jgi:hypothetical protein